MFKLTLRAAVLSSAALLACTHGAPIGARTSFAQSPYQPLTPPSHPRRSAFAFLIRSTPPSPGKVKRDTAIELAQSLLGRQAIRLNGVEYPSDCTGLIQGVYGALGIDVMRHGKPGDNGVTAIYRYAEESGTLYAGGWPAPGDLVFFKETYDQNRDGRMNDGLTHIGLVERAFADGTIVIIHHTSNGVVRYRMNLMYPRERIHPKSGKVINDYLRPARADKNDSLAGELFAGYASLLPGYAPAE